MKVLEGEVDWNLRNEASSDLLGSWIESWRVQVSNDSLVLSRANREDFKDVGVFWIKIDVSWAEELELRETKVEVWNSLSVIDIESVWEHSADNSVLL